MIAKIEIYNTIIDFLESTCSLRLHPNIYFGESEKFPHRPPSKREKGKEGRWGIHLDSPK
jgi:hypothetical protein